jgi:hypothetical protein
MDSGILLGKIFPASRMVLASLPILNSELAPV